MPTRRSRWFAAWYFCIGAGFLLLGLRSWLLDGGLLATVLRWVISVGFVALGFLELRTKK